MRSQPPEPTIIFLAMSAAYASLGVLSLVHFNGIANARVPTAGTSYLMLEGAAKRIVS